MSLTKQDLSDIRGVVVDAINESFEVLSVPRFDALEARMDRIETRMDRIELRMDSFEARLERQEKELHDFRDKVQVRFDQMDAQMQELNAKITMLDEDVKTLYALLESYKTVSSDQKAFTRLSIEKKLATLHTELHKTAKQAGIDLSHS